MTSRRDLPLAACAYTAFYCEENIWQLAGNPALADDERIVLIITNPTRTCMLWQQRAAAVGQPVVWDYHVVLAARSAPEQAWQVYDFDTRLAFPSTLDMWLDETFPGCDQWLSDLLPHFRVVPAADFCDRLVSDRSHMKTAGGWRQPPPPWPCIGTGRSNLQRFLDFDDAFVGECLWMEEVLKKFGETSID